MHSLMGWAARVMGYKAMVEFPQLIVVVAIDEVFQLFAVIESHLVTQFHLRKVTSSRPKTRGVRHRVRSAFAQLAANLIRETTIKSDTTIQGLVLSFSHAFLSGHALTSARLLTMLHFME